MAIVGFAWLIAMVASVVGGTVTVKVVAPDTAPRVAVIVVEPDATAETIPVEPMVATFVADELHVTDDVRSCVLPSE